MCSRFLCRDGDGVLSLTHFCMGAGAHQSWFHLYEVVQPPAVDMGDLDAADGDALSAAGTALEQFMQTATMGEYSARLALLASFQRHAAAQVRSSSMLPKSICPRKLSSKNVPQSLCHLGKSLDE
jgi:hypothetical protein